MTPIESAKQTIDLVSVIEGAGVELKQRGTRHIGLCPFHTEKTPSFYVFPDGHYKCFGCSCTGDCIDFVQKFYNLSFKDALKHLGIEQGPITSKLKRDIKERKRKAEIMKRFRQWEVDYCTYVSDLHFRTKKLMMNGIPTEDLDLYASLFHNLPIWEHHISILVHGSDKEKFKLFRSVENV